MQGIRVFTFALAVCASVAFGASLAQAQELVVDEVEFVKARVVEATPPVYELLPGTGTTVFTQTLTVTVLEGSQKGKQVVFENDYIELGEGDTFYLRRSYDPIYERERYAVFAPNRLPMLGALAALFLATLFFFGGKQGLRGLLALAGSLFVIVYLLIPGMLAGYPPVLVAMGSRP
jgi:hypothetical protein